MVYRPTFASFLGSVAYVSVLPLTALVFLYFRHWSVHWLIWAASGIGLLMWAFFVLQCIVVHLCVLYLDEEGAAIIGPGIRSAMRWREVDEPVLRERPNRLSRTDRAVVLAAGGRRLVYNLSTLSRSDEEGALAWIRAHTNLVTQRDTPSI